MYLIFVSVEVICVGSATLTVRRHRNEIQALQVQKVPQNGEIMAHNAERLRKSAISTFYVYLLFLVTYLPNSCIFVSVLIDGLSVTIEVWSLYILTLVFLNSSLNPLIYCWKMRHIRHAVVDILRNAFSRHN